ncbi:class I SAM-dependent methyltransferase [Nitrosomonas sp. Nm33]|uniref:class I SAM-dependent methyltransferase n=1 Tax=Nitrosomonas sp. Nm33 TaxID=133724 RepID=UPI00089D7422|nr:class I SAM-dependent methyltransferase [Nitrosomonas sp. Nm33]SDY70669.1 Methyltransferase domain-containing protein [Nitrosomonas sp. Nm33]
MSIAEFVKNIIFHYLAVRRGNHPFPPDSVATFAFVLGLQEANDVRANLCEMGVEHGGTAFLLAHSFRHDEVLNLIDLKMPDRFATTLAELSPDLQSRICFYEASTTSPSLDTLSQQEFRIVHIDAGHTKEAVAQDATWFAYCLSPRGVTVFDDVFEIRWPCVTEALLDYLPSSRLAPFMILDRKLCCYRNEDHAFYLSEVRNNLHVFDTFGSLRSWVEPWCGWDTVILKLAVSPHFQRHFGKHA